MKRYFVILIIIICLFTLTGCSLMKKKISLDEFQDYTNSKNYNFFDVTDNFDYNKEVKKAGMAATTVWQIEFYIFDTKEHAIDMFNINKKLFKKDKNNNSYEYMNDGINYKYYTLTTNKTYMYICRVDNTVIYCRVPVEYRNKVKRFIKDMGY